MSSDLSRRAFIAGGAAVVAGAVVPQAQASIMLIEYPSGALAWSPIEIAVLQMRPEWCPLFDATNDAMVGISGIHRVLEGVKDVD